MARCKDYVGVTCVDGSCPKTLAQECPESGMGAIKDCDDCPFYKECEDCAFYATEHCSSIGGF